MAQTTGTLSGFLNSPRKQRRFFILSSAIFGIGVIAFISMFFLRGTGNRFTNTFSNQPAKLYKPDKSVPIQKSEIALARKFILTAVERQDLGTAYGLVHPDLKGRMTKKEWLTGNIPVIQYDAVNAKTAQFTVDYSYQRSALLEVNLISRKQQTKPTLEFFLGLKRAGDTKNGRWLVSYWEPHWRPPVPMSPQ